MSKKITLEDWYDLCGWFEVEFGTTLCWEKYINSQLEYPTFDNGKSIRINRDFLERLNHLLEKKEEDGRG